MDVNNFYLFKNEEHVKARHLFDLQLPLYTGHFLD